MSRQNPAGIANTGNILCPGSKRERDKIAAAEAASRAVERAAYKKAERAVNKKANKK